MVESGPGSADLGTKVFYIWGTTCSCCIIFAYFCIPETKGLSLEQIDLLYRNVTPVRSVQYRKQLVAQGLELGAQPVSEKEDDLVSNEKV
jgi:MFS transporter, SP family, sugar:H+ symporter